MLLPGTLPSLAALSTTLKEPNPIKLTPFPFAKDSVIDSITASTTPAVSFLVRPAFLETRSIKSDFFIDNPF